jgi:beta-lactamase class C
MRLALAVFLLFPLACWASDEARIREVIDSAIRPIMAEHDVPGLALAVTVDSQVIFVNYGVASRENNTPVTETTIFEIGSLSKTFTATLASYAQVLGHLSLNDHPSKYLPQLEGRAIDKATLLNLGTYTAGGLPLQFPDAIAGDAGMISYFQDWKPAAAPGVQRRYSNPSIGLLGRSSAVAMKKEFADALEGRLFTALGLRRSYVRVPESEMANYAWGYGKANTPIRVNPGVLDAEAYGVKSTAADMIRFVQANIDPSRLELSLQEAIAGTHLSFFKVGEMLQGLGWEQYPFPVSLERLLAGNASTMSMDAHTAVQLSPPQAPTASTLFNKTGSTSGFGAYVAFVPEQRVGVVMLANRNFPTARRIEAAHAILKELTTGRQ